MSSDQEMTVEMLEKLTELSNQPNDVLKRRIANQELLLKSFIYWQEKFVGFRNSEKLEAEIESNGAEIKRLEDSIRLKTIVMERF